jgi:hypothetical protein
VLPRLATILPGTSTPAKSAALLTKLLTTGDQPMRVAARTEDDVVAGTDAVGALIRPDPFARN